MVTVLTYVLVRRLTVKLLRLSRWLHTIHQTKRKSRKLLTGNTVLRTLLLSRISSTIRLIQRTHSSLLHSSSSQVLVLVVVKLHTLSSSLSSSVSVKWLLTQLVVHQSTLVQSHQLHTLLTLRVRVQHGLTHSSRTSANSVLVWLSLTRRCVLAS